MPSISLVPNNTWDSMSELKGIPLGNISSTSFSFDGTRMLANAIVYIECVIDDHGDGSKNFGQYSVGDRIICDSIKIIVNGSSVRAMHSNAVDLVCPVSNGGSSVDGLPNTFKINATNANKYKLRCFASHTTMPSVSSGTKSYFDSVIPVTIASIKDQLAKTGHITVPHKLSAIPQVVEVNFICAVAIGGYKVGDVIPLKFVGGHQGSSKFAGVWTTSADTTNVYIGSTSKCIFAPSLDAKGAFIDIMGASNFSIEVCIRKDYLNPYGVTFTEQRLKTPAKALSEKVPEPYGSGDLIDYDLIIINKNAKKSAYAKGTYIFVNQSGGSMEGYDKVSQAQYFSVSTRILHLIINQPTAGQGGFVIYDKGVGKFDIMADIHDGGEWDYVFRWRYENCEIPYRSDTGWMNLDEGILNYPKAKFISDIIGVHDKTHKVDIFVRDNTDDPSLGLHILDSWSLSSLAGGALVDNNSGKRISNAYALSHNKDQLSISTYNGDSQMSFPDYLKKSTRGATGLVMVSGKRMNEYRICTY